MWFYITASCQFAEPNNVRSSLRRLTTTVGQPNVKENGREFVRYKSKKDSPTTNFNTIPML